MSTDRSTNTSYGIDSTTLDPNNIVIKQLEPKTSSNGKYDFAHIKVGYEVGPNKVWALAQKLPDGMRGNLKEKLGDDGITKKYSVTLMHNFDDEEHGAAHEAHAEKLDAEWERFRELIAQSLVTMEADPRFSKLELGKLRARIEKKGVWGKDAIIELIKDGDIAILAPTFQIHVEKDGVMTPIDNAERRLALRMKVKRPEDFQKEEWKTMASKYFFPRSASSNKAEQALVEDMVGIPHTGNYRMKIPYIYIAKGEGVYPKVNIQVFMVSCFNTQPVESSSFDQAIEEEANDAVVSDEKHDELMAIFKRKNDERRAKALEGPSEQGPEM